MQAIAAPLHDMALVVHPLMRMSDAETRLRRVVDNAPIVLWAIDRAGVFTLSEGQGLASLGLRPGEVVGLSAFDLYKDSPDVVRDLRRGLAGDEFSSLVEVGNNAFETRYFPLRDALGALTGVLGVSMEVSARLRAEREREGLMQRLMQTQKLESLGRLSGGIAHDFNNLLTAILGSASAIGLILPPTHSARAHLGTLELAVRHATTLTRQLLAYSGRANFDVRRVDLSAEVCELGNLLARTIAKDVSLRIEAPEGLPPVRVDVAQLQQVLMNLVINAAEATGDAKGTVVVTTGSVDITPERDLQLYGNDVLEPGRYVFLEVQDSGIGMDEATLAKIFDPFFSTKFPGRGLGLAAVLGIVHAHRGGLQVLSAPGKGTTFKMLLPAQLGADDGAPAQEKTLNADRGHGHVLLVDDDDGVRSATQAMLELQGFTVEAAIHGRDAVTRFTRNPQTYDVVLLDMTMPEMNGEEALRALHHIRPNIPVVLMSGYTESDSTERFAMKGLAGFLQKPFSMTELTAALNLARQASR
jgi:signal transduction histidine kinase/ActR/RegA family two-component response regulator